MPELRSHKYEHHAPERPRHLARRLKPPPERPAPPNLMWFVYAGLALAVLVMLIAIPYLIGYIVDLMST